MLRKQIMKPVSSAPALIPGRDPASNKSWHDAVHSVRLSLQQAEIMILDLDSATSKPTEPLVTSVGSTEASTSPAARFGVIDECHKLKRKPLLDLSLRRESWSYINNISLNQMLMQYEIA